MERRSLKEPLIGFSSADDPIFLKLKEPSAIGAHFLLPDEWLSGAKSVISFFLPFTKKVKESNQLDHAIPSREWFHGRIEGQKLVNSLAVFLRAELERSGYPSLVPAVDPRFKWGATIKKNDQEIYNEFTSNWSERHAAFIAGIGNLRPLERVDHKSRDRRPNWQCNYNIGPACLQS